MYYCTYLNIPSVMERKTFIRQVSLAAAAVTVGNTLSVPVIKTRENLLPRWRGFNLLDFFSPDPANNRNLTTDDHLKWMRDWGFDFVRIPIAYPSYLNIDRTKNITPDDVYKISNEAVDKIDALVTKAHKYSLHVSLNLHRAPGYCINAGFYEPYNLWKDEAAQNAFYFHWNMWAKRYRNISRKKISFDLVNEPAMREDMNDQHSKSSAVPGNIYRRVAQGAADAIRKENPDHLVIADGNQVGTKPIPEIIDLNIGQSCRGYHPGSISHYKAPWANKDINNLPEPKWPGQVGNQYLSREMLESFYKPWVEIMQKGVGVHCGECGCWNKTPHEIFLAWFDDLLDILTNAGIGYALWNFIGDFGIMDSRRTDVDYKEWYGHKLDKKLLTLLQKK